MPDVFIEEQERQPWRMCPHCHVLHDGAMGANDAPGAVPCEGAVLVCFDCGGWGILDSTAFGLWRKPTDDERADVMADPIVAPLLDALAERFR